jgi:DNA-directed RNA polymerase I subunit RPA49
VRVYWNTGLSTNPHVRRILFYISALFLFRTQTSKPVERVDLQERLSSLPDVIIETMIAQFTESARGSTRCADLWAMLESFLHQFFYRVQSTPQKETKLLTYALVLCLQVDHFVCDPSIIASDLSLSPN